MPKIIRDGVLMDVLDDGTYIDYPIITPQVLSISPRQFFMKLAIDGVITQDEAEAAISDKTIPTALLSAINSLPAQNRFAARMFIKGANVFERDHPMTQLLAQLMQWSPEQVKALWDGAAAL